MFPNDDDASPSEIPNLFEPPSRGPCGEIPKSPPAVHRSGELLIRLQDHAVTAAGLSPDTVRMLRTLKASGARRVESLRGVWAFSKSMSTGRAPWNVQFERGGSNQAGKLELDEATSVWWRDFPGSDAHWVGVTARHGTSGAESAPVGDFIYTFRFSHIAPGRGFFSLFWAADNEAEWSIGPGGSLEGDRSGTNTFLRSSPLRVLSGTFEPGTVLTVRVRNTPVPGADPDAPNPSGLLVYGRAGTYPEPVIPANTENATPSAERAGVRFVVDFLPGSEQVAVRLAQGVPGSEPALGEILAPPFHPDMQEELRRLYVYFQGEPAADLVPCLRLASPVRYAERVPLSSPASGDVASLSVGSAYKNAIERGNAPKMTQSNLAIFDDSFGSSLNHGRRVWSVACDCLFDGLPKAEHPAPVHCFGVTSGDYIHPANYFTALRDVRIRKPGYPVFRVVNLSRGSAEWYKTELEEIKALEAMDIVMVAAAGQRAPSWMVDYPAAYPTVVSVGGARADGKGDWIPWTDMNCSYDVEKLRCLDKKSLGFAIDVVAPAVSLRVLGPDLVVDGTSFAAPMVAALCAAILDRFPNLTAAQVREAVRQASRSIPAVKRKATDPEPNVVCGAGLIRWQTTFAVLSPSAQSTSQ
jgi:hypothetical protein